jgi:hypothetical protein
MVGSLNFDMNFDMRKNTENTLAATDMRQYVPCTGGGLNAFRVEGCMQ